MNKLCGIQSCDFIHYGRGMCQKHYNSWYHSNNREKSNKTSRRWRTKNAAKVKEYGEEYRRNNRQVVNERSKLCNRKYRKRNKENIQRYHNNRLNNDIQYKLSCLLRTRLWQAIKTDQKTGSAVLDLGCSIRELKIYLESLFVNGMNWDNWSRRGWHIDHIRPLSSFDLSDRDQFLDAVHFTNLQPLWSKDNYIKGSSYRAS